MKFKLSLMTLAAVLAVGYQAQAVSLVTTNSSKLNVSGTIITNGASIDNGTVTKYPTGTTKISNKQLLDLFAAWEDEDRTVEPWKSAQLVIGWDGNSFGGSSGDLLVVDKTGTNVLFDASGDAFDYSTVGAFWAVCDFFNESGAYNGVWSDGDPGSGHFKSWNQAYIEIYDYDHYLPYTDIWADGGSTQNSSEAWDVNDDPKGWSDNERADFPFTGDQYFLDIGSNTTFSGSASASGHGNGWSPFD